MDNNQIDTIDTISEDDLEVNFDDIIEYYSEATDQYAGWGDNFNMHFGYYQCGMNPFNLEPMLENFNRQVVESLKLSSSKDNHVLDMGCGVGGTTRFCAKQANIKSVTGITIVASQIQQAIELLKNHSFECEVTYELQNYHNTNFDNSSFDGVYAMESACHSGEMDKRSIISEAFRVLKPGARFVMSDGFLKSQRPLNFILNYCYKKVCNCWALGSFGELNCVVEQMKQAGFINVKVEDASWRIAPSVAHIPFIAVKYFFTRIFKKNSRQLWNHLIAPIFLLPVSVCKHRFGYYIITAEKP